MAKVTREESGTRVRIPGGGVVLITDADHGWFLDVDEHRVSHLIGLRVNTKGDRAGPVLRVVSVVQS